MQGATTEPEQGSTDGSEQSGTNDDGSLLDEEYSRRGAMRAGAAAGATVVALGAGVNPVAAETVESVNFGSEYVDNPWIEGTVTVEVTEPDMAPMEHVANDGTVTPLSDYGIVLAEDRSDDSTANAHNPVTLSAASIDADEYSDFPRGLTYDDDADSSTDEVDVSALDSTHWSASGMTVSDPSEGVLRLDASAGGDSATLDLSAVGSEDGTIESGVDRKFLQLVADVDALASSASIEFRVTDSGGTQKVARIEDGGDESTTAVLGSTTGDSQVMEVRLGELANDLSDVTSLTVAAVNGSSTIDLHALNLEKESSWSFGTEEYVNSDDEVETRTVKQPSGDFSIVDLDTLPDWALNSSIEGVTYDVELQASALPDEQVYAQNNEAASTYEYPRTLNWVAEFEWPSAYDVSVSAGALKDVVAIAPTRYLTAEVATGVAELDSDDPWGDVDGITWTSRAGSIESVGTTVELMSSTTASDRTDVHFETNLRESEVEDATSASSGSGAAVAVGGSGGGTFSFLKTGVLGVVTALGVWKRKAIAAFLGLV